MREENPRSLPSKKDTQVEARQDERSAGRKEMKCKEVVEGEANCGKGEGYESEKIREKWKNRKAVKVEEEEIVNDNLRTKIYKMKGEM